VKPRIWWKTDRQSSLSWKNILVTSNIFHFGQVHSFVQSSLKSSTKCSNSFAASTTNNKFARNDRDVGADQAVARNRNRSTKKWNSSALNVSDPQPHCNRLHFETTLRHLHSRPWLNDILQILFSVLYAVFFAAEFCFDSWRYAHPCSCFETSFQSSKHWAVYKTKCSLTQ